MQNGDRRVAETVIDDICVSTVFLGIDHNLFGGKPVLFQTMVFSPDTGGGETKSYCTWVKANVGHTDMVHVYRVQARTCPADCRRFAGQHHH